MAPPPPPPPRPAPPRPRARRRLRPAPPRLLRLALLLLWWSPRPPSAAAAAAAAPQPCPGAGGGGGGGRCGAHRSLGGPAAPAAGAGGGEGPSAAAPAWLLPPLLDPALSVVPGARAGGLALLAIYTLESRRYLGVTGRRNREYALLHGYAFYAVTSLPPASLLLLLPPPAEGGCGGGGGGADAEAAAAAELPAEAAHYGGHEKVAKYAILRRLLLTHSHALFLDADAAVFDCRTFAADFDDGVRAVTLAHEGDAAGALAVNTGALLLRASPAAANFLDSVLACVGRPWDYPQLRYRGRLVGARDAPFYGAEYIFDQRLVVDLLARLPFVEVDSHVRLLPFPTFMRLAAYDPPAARGSPGYVAADNFVVHASGPFAAERVALLASLFNQTPCAW